MDDFQTFKNFIKITGGSKYLILRHSFNVDSRVVV